MVAASLESPFINILMSNYKQQEFDFIHRTKSIIEQYNKFKISEDDKFEVTLFLNCLVGLFILPQQHWFDNVSTKLISEEEWGIKESHILFIKETETKNVKDIARHIRNSISHYRFKVFGNTDKKISEIKFEDFNPLNVKTFEATIPLSNFKIFVEKFSTALTTEMTKQ